MRRRSVWIIAFALQGDVSPGLSGLAQDRVEHENPAAALKSKLSSIRMLRERDVC